MLENATIVSPLKAILRLCVFRISDEYGNEEIN